MNKVGMTVAGVAGLVLVAGARNGAPDDAKLAADKHASKSARREARERLQRREELTSGLGGASVAKWGAGMIGTVIGGGIALASHKANANAAPRHEMTAADAGTALVKDSHTVRAGRDMLDANKQLSALQSRRDELHDELKRLQRNDTPDVFDTYGGFGPAATTTTDQIERELNTLEREIALRSSIEQTRVQTYDAATRESLLHFGTMRRVRYANARTGIAVGAGIAALGFALAGWQTIRGVQLMQLNLSGGKR